MATIRPSALNPSAGVSNTDAIIVDSGSSVDKATPLQVVDAAIPLASQVEAEAGTDNAKRVTPLRVSQAISALGITNEILGASGANMGAFTSPLIDDDVSTKAAIESIGTNLADTGGAALVGVIQSGTGAVAETTQAALRRIKFVDQFGAAGDGTTDDRANIQKCLDAAGVGAVIHFTPNTVYRIDPTGNPSGTGSEATFGGLRPLAGQTLMLNGCELKALDANNGASCVINVYGVPNVSIIGGTITGERSIHTGSTGEFGHGVSFREADNFVLRDCIITDCWGDGVYVSTRQSLTTPTSGGLIDNCDFDLIGRNGISVVTANNITISNNKFRRVDRTAPKAAIDLEPDPPSYLENRNIQLFGNRCILDGSGDPQCDSGLYITGRNIDITASGNVFAGLYTGVGIGDNSDNIKIQNNVIRCGTLGSGGNIWYIGTTASTVSNVDISGNDLIGGKTHIFQFGTSGYTGLSITHNNILVNQAGGRLANLRGGTFQHNRVLFSGDALDGQAYIGDFTSCTMGGNDFQNTTGNSSQAYLIGGGVSEPFPDYYGTGLTRDSDGLGAYGSLGLKTGVGGTVTQVTSKATGVTLNKPCGAITMNAAALAASTSVGFTLTNSIIAATDVVIVSIKSGATADSYVTAVDAVAAGSCRISLRNVTAGPLSEAVVLNFVVFKAVAA